MTKFFKRFSICLVAILALFTLFGCKGKGEKELDDKAALLEEKIAGAIRLNLTDFKDPKSVFLVKTNILKVNSKVALVTIGANNSYGSTVSKEYYLVLESITCTQQLFDEMYVDRKNEAYDGSSGHYNTWYDFYYHYYMEKDGVFYFLYGKTFTQMSFVIGDMIEADSSSAKQYILSDIAFYYEKDLSKACSVGKINDLLNDYKKRMGWI